MDACGCSGCEEVFDQRAAHQGIVRYRRSGPDRSTAMLLEMIRAGGVRDATILDIGAGVGVIDHELLRDGASRALLVDGSSAYQSIAREEATARGTFDRMTFLEGDFVARAPTIDPADIVTLDRVVCCYPDVDGLIRASAARARRLYGLVLPRDRSFIRWGVKLFNAWYRLRGRRYRAFAHANERVDALVAAEGLRPRSEAFTSIWRVVLYERTPAAA